MWEKFQKYFTDYCEHSSITGFNYVAEKRSRLERILWIILIVIATALSIYFIMEQYNKYDENPFIVSFATREMPIYKIPFPAITICPFIKTNRSMFNYTNVIYDVWNNFTVSQYEMETAQYMSMICNINTEANLADNVTFNERIYQRLYDIEATASIINSSLCYYMGTINNCNKVFSPIVLDGGICYTFNMLNRNEIYKPNVFQYRNDHASQPKSQWTNDDGYFPNSGRFAYPRRAFQSGADNSLTLVLFATTRDIDHLCFTDIGFSITVHAPNTVPQTKKNFFVLPLDSTSQIVLRPEFMLTSRKVKTFQVKDRKCYFADERKLKYFQSYTQENCAFECLTNYTLDKCSCVNFYMPHEKETKICGNAVHIRKCLAEAEDEIKLIQINANLEDGTNVNYCNCLPLCTKLKYQTRTSTHPWNWKGYFRANKKLRNQIGLEEIHYKLFHCSSLKVFFKSDYFFPTEKNELYGIFDFISNFGGLLGLFNGFSLLAIVEIIYYISLRLWCNKKMYNDVSGPSK